MGLPVVTELLSPFAVPFFQDILACGVIGARTTESQTHRELASSLPFPVGFKNGTDGDLTVAIDAMTATASSQTMVSIDDDGRLVHSCSQGNNDAFVILRGGKGGPNYSPEHIVEAEKALGNAGKQARLVVDCSHGNSAKDYRNQGLVVVSVVDQVAAGSPILGVMIESNINAGKQHISSAEGIGCLKYGVSITDGCVGWEETEKMLDRLASATLQRRQIAVARSHFNSGISPRFAQTPFLKKGQLIETIEELQSDDVIPYVVYYFIGK
ncbi:hypothetical protein SLS53_007679 [Cytospora paraplurivora]|uniref:3-deoxy-7-phosphoheptulonate synthase n=1 Tax=Cytospora paraplurivora TaxID=2898453 RepID=A0AAN9YDG2_9PEZI